MIKLFSSLLALSAVIYGQDGMISGKVQAAQGGAAISGAWVSLIRDATDPQSPPPPFSAGTPAYIDGTFAFTGLNAGRYHLCVSHPGTTWLSSCDWNAQPVQVDVGASQLVANIVITLQKGTTLPLRLDDPAGQLAKNSNGNGAHVVIGLVNVNGRFQPANVKGQDAKGRDHEMLVPPGTAVNVVVYSDFYTLADGNGKDFPGKGNSTSVNVPPGQAAQAMKVTITGVRN